MSPKDKLLLVLRAAAGDPNARSLMRWKLTGADRRLHAHPLREDSLVYDVGGYLGDWTAAMLAKNPCEYHVFEPHPTAFGRLVERFSGNPAVHLHPFALGRGNGSVFLTSEAEGSSILPGQTGGSIEVRLVDICDHLSQDGRRVDLMKLNIEGAEFDLLETLLWSDLRDRVGAFLIQFHRGAPDASVRYRRIAEKLAETHRCVWCYPFLWELWRQKTP